MYVWSFFENYRCWSQIDTGTIIVLKAYISSEIHLKSTNEDSCKSIYLCIEVGTEWLYYIRIMIVLKSTIVDNDFW